MRDLPVYFMAERGRSCNEEGGTYLEERDECKAAAMTLKLPDMPFSARTVSRG